MQIIGEKIYRKESGISGPHLTIFGGVHGNELTGILVVKKLLKALTDKSLRLTLGTLTLGFGNPKAIARGSRGSAPGRDLNRMFIEASMTDPTTYEAERAKALSPILKSTDVMLDLHSTNRTSKPFVIATEGDARRMTLASHFACDDFVIAPDEIISGTTDGWVGLHGGIGVGYESGLATDTGKVPETEQSVLRVMASLGMIEQESVSLFSKRVITLTEAIPMPESGFRFAKGRGHSSFESVGMGEVIGYSAGNRIEASADSLLMFPKPSYLRKAGEPIGFLAKTD